MNVMSAGNGSIRLKGDAGIAIGPILFVIAVLGLLAAAIAAGSGTFTSSTANESNKTKASTLIEIGQNTKVGVDRLMAYGYDLTTLTADIAKTTTIADTFSPTGGGVAPPSTTMAENSGDIWHFILLKVGNIGTGAGNLTMLLPVTQAVCTQVNSIANGIATPAGADIGDMGDNTQAVGANWPAALNGKMLGCFQATVTAATGVAATALRGATMNQAAGTYWFYQVLGIQ